MEILLGRFFGLLEVPGIEILLGGFFGLLLAVLVQPLLQEKAEVLLVRIVGKFWIRPKGNLAGPWMFVWIRDGQILNRTEEVSTELSAVGKRVAARFSWRGRDYWLLGRRETDEFISGTYIDEKAGLSFHGAFQLKVKPNEETMVGKWMGFNSQHKIIDGPWHWRRNNIKEYPFERIPSREDQTAVLPRSAKIPEPSLATGQSTDALVNRARDLPATAKDTRLFASNEVLQALYQAGSTNLLAIDDSIVLASLRGKDWKHQQVPAATLDIGWNGRQLPEERLQVRDPTLDELRASFRGFNADVTKYLLGQLPARVERSQWKLGLIEVKYGIDILEDTPDAIASIELCPLAYWTSEVFNRRIAVLKNQPLEELADLYSACLRATLRRDLSFKLPYPSQLFVELALITSDRRCIFVKKRSGYDAGVVAAIGRPWTCGPEFGLTWKHKANNQIRIGEAICDAVGKEFGVLPEEINFCCIRGVALQHLHLNSALFGYCELSIGSVELQQRFLAKCSDQFEENIVEIPTVEEVAKVFPEDTKRWDNLMWHPTARLRLHSLLKGYKLIADSA